MRRRRRYALPRGLILFLVLLFFGMGLGYAVLYEHLTIDGRVGLKEASWSIYLDNVDVQGGSVSAAEPTLSDTSVSFDASLMKPGDFYEFTVDVVNDGSLAAKLDDFIITPSLTKAQLNYFQYTVTYDDGIPIQSGDALEAHSSEKIRVKFEYLRTSDFSVYPNDSQNFSCNVNLYYIQGHGTEIRPSNP